MEPSQDLIDLLSALKSEGVRFLVVGAYSVGHHAEPRYTKDLDVWVKPTPANALRVWRALVRFGAPLKDIQPVDFEDRESVYSLGVAPHRVDVLKDVDGVEFDPAWKNRVHMEFGDLKVATLSKADLIRAKLAAGRPQDLLDVAQLRTKPKLVRYRKKKRQ